MSEDCLFLNVFTTGTNDNKRRPVMVWLHGGSWVSCASSAPGFNGTNLARAQDVVVVSVNHRLNAFGYIRLDDKGRFADSGCAGVLDLVQALRWVRDNVAAFGGDPNNVTIFGQSGGAAKVMALLAFPSANGLFHKAIIESCSGGMRITGQEEAERQAHSLAKALGIADANGETLQKVPTEKIAGALRAVQGPFRPVVDGRNFKADPFYPTAPSVAADVPILAGNANTETTYYLQVDPRNFYLEMSDVRRRLVAFLKVEDKKAGELIDAYQSVYPTYSPSRILTMITTDYLFKRNTLKAAALKAAAGRAPVYAFVFAHETPVQGGRIHSPHTSEVPFIFGTTRDAEAQLGAETDLEAMTNVMMSTWAAFARNGNPNNKTVPRWEQFSDKARNTMVLMVDSHLANDPGGTARAALDGLPYYEYNISRTKFMRG